MSDDAARAPSVFDPTGLRLGDVVLERAPGKESDLITYVDRGRFSHALIWVGGTDFVEAIDGGSRTISFARVVVSDSRRWSLLRYSGIGGAAAAEKAAFEARNLVFKPYNTVGAVLSVTPVRHRSFTSLFCSELVALAYERAGGVAVPRLRRERVTPRRLETSPNFFRVEPLPFVELSAAMAATVAADRCDGYQGTIMERENLLSQAAFNAVVQDLGALKASARGVGWPPGNLADVIDVLRIGDPTLSELIAAQVHQVLDEGGYYRLIDGEMLKEQLAAAPAADEIMIGGWRTSFERASHNYKEALITSIHRPWPLWKSLANMHKRNAAFFGAILSAAGRPVTSPEG